MRFILLLGVFSLSALARADEKTEFFEKKIRPILVDQCQSCHGSAKQKGDLRIDSLAALLKGGETGPAIVPGKSAMSLLVKAVRYDDDLKMPPKGKLEPGQIADLTKWIDDGAVWPGGVGTTGPGSSEFDLKKRIAELWSMQPIGWSAIPAIPHGPDADRIANPVDAWIVERLQRSGLKLNVEADRRTLIRRLTLDLTGLPPTPAEVEAFVADTHPRAYEQLVDRLLASPRYGERWGRHWLDLVRYAETLGHEFDFELPEAWRYRDYVIRALNSDLPYDQFIREHVAGDLMADPRRHPKEGWNESVLATAYWFLGEAKHSPVDVRQDQADRIDNQIDVFAKTFLGLTVACARCHDHKFDPISTKDYYALYGMLSSSRQDRAVIDGSADRTERLRTLRNRLQQRESLLIDRTAAALGSKADTAPLKRWAAVPGDLGDLARIALAGESHYTAARADLRRRIADRGKARRAWEERAKPVVVEPSASVQAGEAFLSGAPRAYTDDSADRILSVASPTHGRSWLGTKLYGSVRTATFTINSDYLAVTAAGKGARVSIVLEGLQLIQSPIYGELRYGVSSVTPQRRLIRTSMWKGRKAYVEIAADGDGFASLDDVTFVNVGDGPPPSAGGHLVDLTASDSAAQLSEKLVTEIDRLLTSWKQGRALSEEEAQLINGLIAKGGMATTPTAAERKLSEEITGLVRELGPVRRAQAIADGTGLDERVFIRGNHKTPGIDAPRTMPEALPRTAVTKGSGRREAAESLLDPKHPLTSRVIVNRLWRHHFGEGIVRTPDDFGKQGTLPTHPELLDWLARELMENQWSLKHLHRLMVTSATYRQSSIETAEGTLKDPKNEFLHRMPVRRLEAEAIRDSILAVSGRLEATMEGPSVPPHLTPFMQGRGRPPVSGPVDGAGRRSIYLQVRRNFLNPFFLAFDYPTPFTTIGRRSSSNVPAQALAMMNNPFVRKQAEVWAKRVQETTDPNERIRRMYAEAFGRPPSSVETAEAQEFLAGATGKDAPLAWVDLAHVLYNLKEFTFIP